MKIDNRRFAVACAAICFVTSEAIADTHFTCVTTAQELQQALTDASDGGMYNNVEEVIIALAPGTYKTGTATGNQPFHYTSTASGRIEIDGGYGPLCSNGSGSATLAKVDGNGATQVMNLKSKFGGIYLYQFTIQNGNSSANGGGLNVNYGQVTDSGQQTSIEHMIIKNNHADNFGGALVVSTDSIKNNAITLDGDIIINNSAGANFGAGIVENTGTGQVLVTHDTVFSNTTQTGGTGGLSVITASSGTSVIGLILDSIFWGNTSLGLNLTGTHNILKYCDYGNLGGDPPSSNSGSLSISPKFVDAANENFHLASDSPLLGAAYNYLGLVLDPERHQYAVHGDIGTYAETIFIGDFEVSAF